MRKVLRFTADWCQPCKRLAAILETIETEIPIEVYDIEEHPDFAAKMGIRGIPTMVMMNDDKEEKRMTGFKSKLEIQKWLED